MFNKNHFVRLASKVTGKKKKKKKNKERKKPVKIHGFAGVWWWWLFSCVQGFGKMFDNSFPSCASSSFFFPLKWRLARAH